MPVRQLLQIKKKERYRNVKREIRSETYEKTERDLKIKVTKVYDVPLGFQRSLSQMSSQAQIKICYSSDVAEILFPNASAKQKHHWKIR